MKEFIEKLIARIMLESASCKVYKLINPNKEDIAEFNAYKKCIEIVNQLAEEYSKDKDWKTTRRYLDEKYFSKIRELSAKYNYPCEDIPINFDWVFGLIEKIEGQLAEEYNNDWILVHTQGLDVGIQCAMCTNPMKSNRGCDGGCSVNEEMYKKVLDVIERHTHDAPYQPKGE